MKTIITILLLSTFILIPVSYAGNQSILPIEETDTYNYQLYYFFDLRDRESFIQVTNPFADTTVHFQIFDVGNLCTENNFFDTFTPSDSHVYNMRDIQTNNGSPSGVVLSDNAYGFVIVTAVIGAGQQADLEASIFGNFRVIDDSGYEYRTNAQGPDVLFSDENGRYTFNFNTISDVTASDVIGITVNNITSGEVTAAGSILEFVTNLYNDNEVPFSCSNTVFSCTPDTFEYGINDALPSSMGKSVLCGSNNIPDGFAVLDVISGSSVEAFAGYVGLNNGNGRGSMDSLISTIQALNTEMLRIDRNGFSVEFLPRDPRPGNDAIMVNIPIIDDPEVGDSSCRITFEIQGFNPVTREFDFPSLSYNQTQLIQPFFLNIDRTIDHNAVVTVECAPFDGTFVDGIMSEFDDIIVTNLLIPAFVPPPFFTSGPDFRFIQSVPVGTSLTRHEFTFSGAHDATGNCNFSLRWNIQDTSSVSTNFNIGVSPYISEQLNFIQGNTSSVFIDFNLPIRGQLTCGTVMSPEFDVDPTTLP